MNKFLRIYGVGLLLLGPALIAFGLIEPVESDHRLSMSVLVGFNALIVGGFMLLTAHRRR